MDKEKALRLIQLQEKMLAIRTGQIQSLVSLLDSMHEIVTAFHEDGVLDDYNEDFAGHVVEVLDTSMNVIKLQAQFEAKNPGVTMQ